MPSIRQRHSVTASKYHDVCALRTASVHHGVSSDITTNHHAYDKLPVTVSPSSHPIGLPWRQPPPRPSVPKP
ncbi:hypothetical protein BBBOND_0110160 [Babesia bigemina]|uniref:Uncharacterized protein n=1 Tax=Babesia bigemina TaxID=5866 RepID=A0A061D277_BABBI|nr:hypothetical protein BBBOND_0110160 [Babesia bigemina]CDR94718.1 hypothetical protein BBBOND_0110160 [Babesia bigemina]|eukprot:XP_012766904.1 hypothetical protein BBBOND_0110160 [Babesia bigemina]